MCLFFYYIIDVLIPLCIFILSQLSLGMRIRFYLTLERTKVKQNGGEVESHQFLHWEKALLHVRLHNKNHFIVIEFVVAYVTTNLR